MIGNPPASGGDAGLTIGPGGSRMPQCSRACAPQLLSLCSRVLELQLRKPSCPRTRAPQEKASHCCDNLHAAAREWPRIAATREKPVPAVKT